MIEAVADYLDLPPVWAYEVASFYSMIDQKPTGRHKVNICTNISCWLNGAEEMVAHVEESSASSWVKPRPTTVSRWWSRKSAWRPAAARR